MPVHCYSVITLGSFILEPSSKGHLPHRYLHSLTHLGREEGGGKRRREKGERKGRKMMIDGVEGEENGGGRDGERVKAVGGRVEEGEKRKGRRE